MNSFKPKIITTLKNYSLGMFQSDVLAGLIVGIVALPLSIAFAVAAGISPEKGIITAIIAGFLISVFGGSRVQIGGPTGAFIIIIYNIVEKFGIDGLIVANIMAGCILLIIGFLNFGAVIKFIPYPVTTGFTSGIAVIIFIGQVKDFLGISAGKLPSEFVERIIFYKNNLSQINFTAFFIAMLTVVIIIAWKKVSKKIPGSIVALIATTLIVYLLKLPVDTIGSRFGEISSSVFSFSMPDIANVDFKALLQPAFVIAILAGIESLLSAMVADGMTGGRHRSNMEIVAQGIANIITPFFGGIPATGAIARTAVNIHNGAKTPVAGIVHSLTLLLVVLFLGHLAVLIPMPALAGILVLVAYNMSEVDSFSSILKGPRNDTFVLLVTFLLTVFLDLTVAIPIGMIMAAFLIIHRIASNSEMTAIIDEFVDEEERDDPNAVSKRKIPDKVEIYEINGPFFFGMISTFVETMNNIKNNPRMRILRMRHVSTIDATALNALRQVIVKSHKNKIIMVLSGVSPALEKSLRQAGIIDLIGEENITCNIDEAIKKAHMLTS